MGTLHREIWVSSGAGTSRAQRASGVYHWFMPDSLAVVGSTALDGDVVADVARAERELATCAEPAMRSTEGIARLLLRSEAVASSQIEGLVIGSKRLMRAELQALEPDNMRYDAHAATVLGNIHAMESAVALAASSPQFEVDTICEVHRALVEGTSLSEWGGMIRTSQNWVGGSSYNPLTADYVPPAPQEVVPLLRDLVDFANRDDVSPVVQAALCHAQFETIHPFVDGNGRTGRALIQVCLLRRGVSAGPIPPISLALATMRDDYFSCLHAYQRATDGAALSKATNDWVSCFAGAVSQACVDVAAISSDLARMREGWLGLLGSVRRGSALEALLDEVQGMPIFSVDTLVRATGRTKQTVAPAVRRLVDVGIAVQTNRGKRNRVYEVPEVLEEFNMVERRLASPARDTLRQPPARPVPSR